MKLIASLLAMIFLVAAHAQEQTAASLYLKKDKGTQLDSVSSSGGNLFRKLGHHGPAVENPWTAFRLYFDKRTAIDLYSKAKPGMELHKYQWYPAKDEQLAGSGADCYKVGKTLGLGGIRLWEDGELRPLHPVKCRWAIVGQERDSSWMEMYSMGVPYGESQVDILIRVSVYPGQREARITAISLGGEPLCFATGINYFETLRVEAEKGCLWTWGLHPEDIAATETEVGAALLYRAEDFEEEIDDGKQILLISRPGNRIQTWVSSANSREDEINTPDRFLRYLKTTYPHIHED